MSKIWIFAPGEWEELIETQRVYLSGDRPHRPKVGDVGKMKDPTYLWHSLRRTFWEDRQAAVDCLADGLDHMIVDGVALRRYGQVEEIWREKVMSVREVEIVAEPEGNEEMLGHIIQMFVDQLDNMLEAAIQANEDVLLAA